MNQRLWLTGFVCAVFASLLSITLMRGCNDDRPTPDPGPGPVPFPSDVIPIKALGFRVLVIYESSDGVPDQINGVEIRSYLDSKCAKGPDGKTPDYRIWDQDVDLTNASTYLAEAMKRPRATLPWILISDGERGCEGPLPATAPLTLELLKKYGG